ncbi:outer membrane beta-barrel family protein [Arenibacter certesii]|uniref:TonB-dependent receptor n=1 Tax=Arenibacter certesii TaxID=228955 RepID=A0A918J2T3_9FLAO|nr:outer membrane beta-barrel family protein [Arenibacter certesii]GGW43832.1 TonB-dependent receptor [Arenibacter certesii]
MKNYILSFLFYLLLSVPIRAQEFKVSGTVIHTDNSEISFANILLYTAADTSFVKGSVTDEIGFFSVDQIPAAAYLLKASYMGNHSQFIKIDVQSNIDIGLVSVDSEAQALDEVVVVFQKPTLEQKVDRLVFNIGNTALSESNIWEALKSTPSVFIMNNEITVKGEKGVQVLINDKKVNLPQEDILNLLNGTSANGVQAIEVITAPPAKYDAEGGTMINIRMNKNLIAGYNGAVFNRYTQGNFPQHTLGTNHYFKGEKLETSFNYSFSQRKELTNYTDITNYMENGAITDIWTSDLEVIDRSRRHNSSIFLDYKVNTNNTISFSSITTFTPKFVGRDYSETVIRETNDPNSTGFFTKNDSKFSSVNTAFYLDYENKLNDEGALIAFNAHYTFYDYDKNQELETDFYDERKTIVNENAFSTTNQQRTDLYSIQTDYSTPLGESFILESGFKYALTSSESDISQQGFNREQPGIDPMEDGQFLYDENIYAAYTSVETKWENWSFKSGLRAEYTKTKGDFSLDKNVIGKDYLELFPTVFFQFTPTEKHRFGLNYKRSIIRPDYSTINPFQVFQSSNSVVEGNVNLRPSFKNSAIFSYTYDKDYTLELFYRYHKNAISLFTYQDNESKLLRFITDNLDRELAYGLDFIYRKEIVKAWDAYLLTSYFYASERFNDRNTNNQIDNNLWTLLVQFKNNLTFLEDRSLTANLNFTYVSPIVVGNSRQREYSDWEIALKKNIWSKKANISLTVSDIFNQFKLHNTRDYGDQYNISYYRPDSRTFTLGFRYNFGNMGIRDNYKNKDTEERERL